ncbi:hypothetical protein [Streptomyces pseudoechinosporeus]
MARSEGAGAPRGGGLGLELSAAIQWRLYQVLPWPDAVLNLSRLMVVQHGMRHIDWAPAALDGLGPDAGTRIHAAVTLFGYVRVNDTPSLRCPSGHRLAV